jgi:dihydrofolate reductase
VLIYSMGVSVDGFINDRTGAFGWTVPSDEQFRFHIAQVREVGVYLCGRRLYETMLVCDTDPSLCTDELRAEFAEIWCARATVAEEVAVAIDATDKDVSIGGADLAAQAIQLGLVDELRMFRNPVLVGDGTPFLPAVNQDAALDLVQTRTFDSRVIYERYRCGRNQSVINGLS